MDLEGKSINRIYSIKGKKGESRFYEIWEATSIYSATVLDLHFYKHSLTSLPDTIYENIKASFFKLVDIQTPYLYSPFEIDTIDDSFYLAYPQINSTSLKNLFESGVIFPYEIALKIVINIVRGLVILEKKNLHHNLLSAETVWLTESGLDITNIKISGFLDHFLLDSRVTSEQNAALDIHNLGILLYQLLTGKSPGKQDTISFENSIPSWVSAITKTMLNDPLSFNSIQILLDLFLSKAPARSILEDSIEDRIAKSNTMINNTESSQDFNLEELVSPQDGISPTPFPKEKVKEFVSFILSLFRRKKKKNTPGDNTNKTISPDEQENNGVNEEAAASIKNKATEEPYSRNADFSNRIESQRQQLDPWNIEKNRYKDSRNESPGSSAVPLYHNKPASNPQLGDPERYKTEGPVQDAPAEAGINGKKTHQPEPPVTAEERIKMLKEHRESEPVEDKFLTKSATNNRGKVENKQIQQQELHDTKKLDKQHQSIEISSGKTVKPEVEINTDSGNTDSGQPSVQPVPTLLQRILRWLKTLFTGRGKKS